MYVTELQSALKEITRGSIMCRYLIVCTIACEVPDWWPKYATLVPPASLCHLSSQCLVQEMEIVETNEW